MNKFNSRTVQLKPRIFDDIMTDEKKVEDLQQIEASLYRDSSVCGKIFSNCEFISLNNYTIKSEFIFHT